MPSLPNGAYSPDIARAVLAGSQLFDKALEEVKAEQSKLTSAESQLACLREEAPDLADFVAEEREKLISKLKAEGTKRLGCKRHPL